MREPLWHPRILIFIALIFITSPASTEITSHYPQEGINVSKDTKRKSLIVLPAGDTSLHTEWLATAKTAGRNWDLVLLYYGMQGNNFKCEECVAVVPSTGAKWRLLSGFLNSTLWTDKLVHRYDTVMVPDDDLYMHASVLNHFFNIFCDYHLTLAQPALCPGSNSAWAWILVKQENSTMRFTNFVELMAPTFSTKFLDTTVRSTLGEAYTGWGLDFVWPFLLKFPKDKVAVVDQLCMEHLESQTEGRQRVYDADMPRNSYEEKDYLLAKFNYNEESLAQYQMEVWRPIEFGKLPLSSSPSHYRNDIETLPERKKPPKSSMKALRVIWFVVLGVAIAAGVMVRRRSRRRPSMQKL